MNEKKSKQLGMPFGTATGRLKKNLLFDLVQKTNQDRCFRCNELIETVDELSVEHKIAWQDVDVSLFWDLNNIAFSHRSCNVAESRKTIPRTTPHGSSRMYEKYKCRCDECKEYKQKRNEQYRLKKKNASVEKLD